MLKSFVVGMLSVLLFAATAAAQTQVLSVLAPIQPSYKLGDFDYRAPSEDGWRQVTSAPNSFVLVYAETVPPDQINTRIQVDAEAFVVPDPAVIRDLMWLTEQSQAQQVKERGDNLLAFSKIAPIASTDKVLSYALVTRAGDADIHEVFYVTLAPDKTSYLVAKMTTKEQDYRQQVYFGQFEVSLASLTHNPPARSEPEKSSSPSAATPPKGG
jgi:hypothetical protein